MFTYFHITTTMPRKNEKREYEIVKKTIYAEARGEPLEGQIWVAWVIRNRADANRSYWGGSRLDDVCKKPGQFECWNGISDIQPDPNEYGAYKKWQEIDEWLPGVLKAPKSQDPTGGCDHYNNPEIEGPKPGKAGPAWGQKWIVLFIVNEASTAYVQTKKVNLLPRSLLSETTVAEGLSPNKACGNIQQN
ncbi:unnamed protein product [Darwinula stevensoni]|uniref:Cell wall hydrolase SleB domain-containing protein n=1 Tax=Darwinula stevensoni TaxID=69355 RepID=A0A7R9AGC3_9CRUS|nr:unnamed protein product [Darwinula stevensoni]CAG0903292.1 unnamed protein product [Darwinula stevensoni]